MSELLVLAVIAGKRCAFCASDVGSVIEAGVIAPVPRAPRHVVGITALRSQAMTVIDCRTAIAEDPSIYPCDSHLAVIEVAGHSYALQVDKIDDIATAQSGIAPVPGGSGKHWNRVCKGMLETDRGPALLIDVEQVVAGIEQKSVKAA
ncbi:MAG: chemotaxis protein CheW [Altererythrobacter sp.]|nr:chemotaxis protein CheW [Altererythrobacter sp.]NNF93181.1 chemotaxis protein CheW [Altererythrobacter sp.]NNK45108.1 chemotaxis protein CheW [Altererythrobacter sp.]